MYVAPYVGAWIETDVLVALSLAYSESHPTWVRGLKPARLLSADRSPSVAPYVGAWIETRR